ncbi:MAG: hypothetical protein ACLVFS_05805 [Butyricicoccus sp.]
MNRRMIATALACLACTAGLSACSLTGTGDTHHIAVIIKHAGEHFQNVMAGAEACASEHPNVTIDIQFPSLADDSAEQLDLFRSALDVDSVDAVVISPMQSGSCRRPPKYRQADHRTGYGFHLDKTVLCRHRHEAAAKSGGLAA